MHKITKGLKKKKKGKKSKHKEDELFKPEELEAYRRDHQQTAVVSKESKTDQKPPVGGDDEWKKFNAITAGIDHFLKKTQDDLERIKSESFFQRIPPPSEIKSEENVEETSRLEKELAELEAKAAAVVEPGIVPVSESESEEEDEEDIFDTSYIDVIAAGEIKLAYIPESPTNEQPGDDPFDTSIAERAILGPALERKGKKLVPLGAAVEVLTGRVQAPTCLPIKRPSTRRTVVKEKDLLLGSFDDNANELATANKGLHSPEQKPSLLDDYTFIPLSDEPIDLSKTLHQIVVPVAEEDNIEEDISKTIIEEFDLIKHKAFTPEDEDDKEFALLAAESLSKTPAVALLPVSVDNEPVKDSWKAFDDERQQADDELKLEFEDDPFDTTFAEKAVPGKAELKVIENEVLYGQNDIDFKPTPEDKLKELIKNTVSIEITNPAGRKDSLEHILESELNTIRPQHRDLLGGSISDLSALADQPLKPKEKVDENYIEYCDPFDTSIVDIVTIPGQAELKFLEKELLSDITVVLADQFSDDDFDPRADEIYEQQGRKTSTASLKAVNFTLPLQEIGEESSKKISKPLTPYYVRENSLPEQPSDEDDAEDIDPFDTSFVARTGPGKAEIRAIESELFQADSELKRTLSDPDFDPRDEKQVAVAKVVQTIKEIYNPINLSKLKELKFEKQKQVDLLAVEDQVTVKVLTPAAELQVNFNESSYSDPFDTSIASNILPGKAELKLLESELIHSSSNLKRDLTDPDFNPRDVSVEDIKSNVKQSQEKNISDLLEHTTDTVSTKPLTPIVGARVNFEIGDDEDGPDYDPFDTSIANNIGPGQTELKLLESELIH